MRQQQMQAPHEVNWRRAFAAPAVVLCGVFLVCVGNRASSACDITKLVPRIAQAPLRYIRFSVVIEDRNGGDVALVSEAGLETSSLVQPGARTTLIEWKNLVLPPGEYEVQLRAGKCTARATLQVAE